MAHTWANEIVFILRDRDASFKRVHALRSLLQKGISWDSSIESMLHELRIPPVNSEAAES